MNNVKITPELIEKLGRSVKRDGKYCLAQNILVKSDLRIAARNYELINQVPQYFEIDLEPSSPTDQKNSGRCWLFGTLNSLRHQAEKKLKTERVEFSESYLFFYDQLEKANLFLENTIKYAGRKWTDRLVKRYFYYPVSDGGWDVWAGNLVDKYGLVPREVMPDHKNVSNTYASYSNLICRLLRRHGLKLRDLAAKDKDRAREYKEVALADAYRLLCLTFGEPPKQFSWTYRDKKKKLHTFDNITPLEFKRKLVGRQKYLTLINNPAYAYGKTYRYRSIGQGMVGKHILYLNLPFDQIRSVVVSELESKRAVVFSANVLPYNLMNNKDDKQGVMSTRLYDWSNLLDIDTDITKEGSVKSMEGLANHEMLIVGLQKQNDKPAWWKVENSWGNEAGAKGFFAMDDDWFERYTESIAIFERNLPEDLQKLAKQKPIVLGTDEEL